jgi:hypothetical protein
MEKAPESYESRAFLSGGLGRNRTADTRIFNPPKKPTKATGYDKNHLQPRSFFESAITG